MVPEESANLAASGGQLHGDAIEDSIGVEKSIESSAIEQSSRLKTSLPLVRAQRVAKLRIKGPVEGPGCMAQPGEHHLNSGQE
jgi:hypothetical protein